MIKIEVAYFKLYDSQIGFQWSNGLDCIEGIFQKMFLIFTNCDEKWFYFSINKQEMILGNF